MSYKRITLRQPSLTVKTYNPDAMLDGVITRFGLKNDAALCRALGISPAVISKIRHQTVPVSAEMLLRIHDVTQVPISALRAMMGTTGPNLPVLKKRRQ